MYRKLIIALLLLFTKIEASNSITGHDSVYRSMCLKAATVPYYFQNFRSMPGYTHALEISDGSSFAQYLIHQASQKILKELDAFRRLDNFGNPPTTYFPNLGNFSATTLRYIAIADEINKLFILPEHSKIVEVGAGFGGQCYILSQLHTWSKYYIYDLPEPTALIEKMMTALDVKNVVCMPTAAQLPEGKVDLFISNYAYSECDRETQIDYFERLIKKADRGYLIYNQTSDLYAINSLTIAEFIQLLEKNGVYPRVYNELVPTFVGNLLIVWDKTR